MVGYSDVEERKKGWVPSELMFPVAKGMIHFLNGALSII